ncbi:MAG: hypothetical protein Q9181_000922 [Wetmoreana brouardii]
MLSRRYLRCTTQAGPLRFYRCISAREGQPAHTFSTSSRRLSNPLFNLGGLSTSRESQYLSKEHGIPRTEFAPHIELIRSSEVDTQRAPGSTTSKTVQSVKGKNEAYTTVKEKQEAYTTNKLITVPKEEYNRMEKSIDGLKKRLEATEQRLRRVSASKRRLIREMTFGLGICTMLIAGSIYLNNEQNLLASKTQAGQAVEEEKQLEHEGLQLQTVPPISEFTEEVDQVRASAISHTNLADDAKSRQPSTFSRLFWAGQD